MQAASAAATAALEEIFARVFRRLRPLSDLPEIRVRTRRYASASARIKLEKNLLVAHFADTLLDAPEAVWEALAEILLCKVFRKPVPAHCNQQYRTYLNSQAVRRNLEIVRQQRGRKRIADPKGRCYDLIEIFEELNRSYFHGLIARPRLGWSPGASRSLLGHYDPSHNSIVLSGILDRNETPRLVVDYVMFHEMLHLRFPADHSGTRRRVHTREFKQAEKLFNDLDLAKSLIRRLL